MNDYYRTLNLSLDASPEQIRIQYKNLVRIFHPDQFSQPVDKVYAQHKLKEINEAYTALIKYTPSEIRSIEPSIQIPHHFIVGLLMLILIVIIGLFQASGFVISTLRQREHLQPLMPDRQSALTIEQNTSSLTTTGNWEPLIKADGNPVDNGEESTSSSFSTNELSFLQTQNQVAQAGRATESNSTSKIIEDTEQVGGIPSINTSTIMPSINSESLPMNQLSLTSALTNSVVQKELPRITIPTTTNTPLPSPTIPPPTATSTAMPTATPTFTPFFTSTPTVTPTSTNTPLPTATVTAQPAFTYHQLPPAVVRIPDTYNVNARSDISTQSDVLEILTVGTQWVVEGRTVDNAWLRIILSDGRRAWVFTESVHVNLAFIESIPILIPQSLKK
ncbi:DnaJ domain-containing protein [Chloroflexi bacterium TSY]|nr:DnaJ domain-containing protein [Chloroflexi bacterium TSY]